MKEKKKKNIKIIDKKLSQSKKYFGLIFLINYFS